jgi:hypothetical protein
MPGAATSAPARACEDAALPAVTIVVEWENALDVEDRWTSRAMAAFAAELERCRGRLPAKPAILYLYDERAVREETIRAAIARAAPGLLDLGEVSIVPTPGLSYYQLKNRGAELARTDIVVMLDSDAGPEPGWLPALLQPFSDPAVQAVGDFTRLGYEDLLSRTMALSWIFDLACEKDKTRSRRKIHANNCAFRTPFLRANPYPELPAFKKQCGFWLRDIERRNIRWVRSAEAMTVHAPHPGGSFLLWRAWTTGTDRDFQVFHTLTPSRAGRIAYGFYFLASKVGRAWWRIWTKGGEVELPVWQRPAAMLIALGFFGAAFAGELASAVSRRFPPLPAGLGGPPLASRM